MVDNQNITHLFYKTIATKQIDFNTITPLHEYDVEEDITYKFFIWYKWMTNETNYIRNKDLK